MDMREIRRVIRLTRQNRGYSQEAVAQRAGVSMQTVSRLESGKHTPPADILLAVLGALDLDMRIEERSKPVDNLPWFLDPAGDSESARKLRGNGPAPLAPPTPAPTPADAQVSRAEMDALRAEVRALARELRGEGKASGA